MPASKKEAKEFVKRWQKRLAAIPAGSNNEQQDTQKFWVDLLINVLGIPSNTIDSFVDFERKVRGRRIDVFVSDHNFLCEQKSWGIDLDKPEPRNGGMETPLQQAMWYARHLPYSEGKRTRCALVSTNSICQGEQVANLWKPLYDLGIHIDFAHNTFRWDNEAADKAHVFCVIVGFSRESGTKTLFYHATPDSDEEQIPTARINAYLKDAPDVFIYSRSKPICDVPEMGIGNKPIDGGFYLFTDEEKDDFLKKEPKAEGFFHPWLGSKEFIHGYHRWCLWLGEATFSDLKQLPECRKRVEQVREYRLASKSAGTRKIADKPTRFHVENMPEGSSIIIPEVSSSRRKRVPMGFVGPEIFCSNKVRLIPNASLYHYGILQSQFHNAWVRIVTGRLKDDYQYSANIDYNNFVWPEPTESQRKEVERCARAVLDARDAQEGATLADMYDPKNETFFPELMAAHKALDTAVEAAYGVDFGGDEEKIVAHLFNLYAEKVGEL